MRAFIRAHKNLLPMLVLASVASSYMACGDSDTDPTLAPADDAGLDAPRKDDGAALDGTSPDATGATDTGTTDSAADAPADAPEDAPEDGPDDAPTSNG